MLETFLFVFDVISHSKDNLILSLERREINQLPHGHGGTLHNPPTGLCTILCSPLENMPKNSGNPVYIKISKQNFQNKQKDV